jgi:hypothetical protein
MASGQRCVEPVESEVDGGDGDAGEPATATASSAYPLNSATAMGGDGGNGAHLSTAISAPAAAQAEMGAPRRRRRQRPSSPARRRRTLKRPAETVETTDNRIRTYSFTTRTVGAEARQQQSRQVVLEMGTLLFPLRRQAGLAAKEEPEASAAMPTPAARPQPVAPAVHHRPRTPQAAGAGTRLAELCRHSERDISEQSWPFKTPEGVVGWRWRSRTNDLYELLLLQPPWRGSELLHLVGNERPN